MNDRQKLAEEICMIAVYLTDFGVKPFDLKEEGLLSDEDMRILEDYLDEFASTLPPDYTDELSKIFKQKVLLLVDSVKKEL